MRNPTIQRRPETAPAGKYAIINDIDAPQPDMVVQWLPSVGYCYLDRTRGKPKHDGMSGAEATSLEAFGWTWAEDEDGGSWVRFYRTDQPSAAVYSDGKPRRWQDQRDYFEGKRLALGVSSIRGRKRNA